MSHPAQVHTEPAPSRARSRSAGFDMGGRVIGFPPCSTQLHLLSLSHAKHSSGTSTSLVCLGFAGPSWLQTETDVIGGPGKTTAFSGRSNQTPWASMLYLSL